MEPIVTTTAAIDLDRDRVHGIEIDGDARGHENVHRRWPFSLFLFFVYGLYRKWVCGVGVCLADGRSRHVKMKNTKRSESQPLLLGGGSISKCTVHTVEEKKFALFLEFRVIFICIFPYTPPRKQRNAETAFFFFARTRDRFSIKEQKKTPSASGFHARINSKKYSIQYFFCVVQRD